MPWPRGRIIPAAGLLLCGALLAGPAVAQQGAGDARPGWRLAAARCAACLGAAGRASPSDTPDLAYLEIQLRAFRRGERPHAPMYAVARTDGRADRQPGGLVHRDPGPGHAAGTVGTATFGGVGHPLGRPYISTRRGPQWLPEETAMAHPAATRAH
ncbi:hypothetical protein [Dankookia sp. GCM10030260]|uniref:hypothetical protein n=1 Tax=Dankookia sp. GCM10030260 TaxID=3273390 RepID=UPI0036D2DF4E